MIKVSFQALDNYQKKEADFLAAREILSNISDKYPKLFEEKEVLANIKVSINSKTLKTSITFIIHIPSFETIYVTAEEQTFNQALSAAKDNLDRLFRDLIN